MYCNGFLVVMIFFYIFSKKSQAINVFILTLNSKALAPTPGRVSSPEHPGPSLEPLFDIFCVSQLSAVNSPSAVHTFLSLLVFVCLGAGIWVAVRGRIWGAHARLLPC